jgi:hypothetical protein
MTRPAFSLRVGSRAVAIALGLLSLALTACGKLPSTPPPGAVSVSSSNLIFYATGPSYAQTFTVSQPNYAGGFSEKDNCNGIVTFNVTSNGFGSAAYSVIPETVGNCQVTIKGGDGHRYQVSIIVTSSSGGID